MGLLFWNTLYLLKRPIWDPRSFPLTGLSELSNDLQDIVIEVLQRPPGQRRAFTLLIYTVNFRNDTDYDAADRLLTDMSQDVNKFVCV